MLRAIAMLVLDALGLAISLVLISMGGKIGIIALFTSWLIAAHLAVSSRNYAEYKESRGKH